MFTKAQNKQPQRCCFLDMGERWLVWHDELIYDTTVDISCRDINILISFSDEDNNRQVVFAVVKKQDIHTICKHLFIRSKLSYKYIRWQWTLNIRLKPINRFIRRFVLCKHAVSVTAPCGEITCCRHGNLFVCHVCGQATRSWWGTCCWTSAWLSTTPTFGMESALCPSLKILKILWGKVSSTAACCH